MASTGYTSCTSPTPCLDFTTMCDYCWSKFEAGEKHPNHPTLTCNDPSTRCDFCWRAYETGSPETVVPENDNCLSASTMCDPCRNAFNALKERFPEEHLLAKPGTYPVVFIRRFERAVVDEKKTYVDDITDVIKVHLHREFGRQVDVHAMVVTPAGADVSSGASVLVDFPHFVDVSDVLLKKVFGDLFWVRKVPREEQCLSEFRLTWWKAMFDMGGWRV
ncbi:hypothetical protein BDV18DRAFT_161052 [Aspergillus unguis]